MRMMFVGAMLSLMASPCLAEAPTTREATLELISQTLAEVNEANTAMQGQYPASVITDKVEDALKKVADLRDTLANNPYVRITSFTVAIPWGVSVEFEFVADE